MKVLPLYISLALLFTGLAACDNRNGAEEPAFWGEIQKFKEADSLHRPSGGGILFVGSSSFRLWTDLEVVFKDYAALNRGFGGATLLDLNRYANNVIFPYQPRQIVIYCGENDLPADTVTAQMLLSRFKEVFSTIREKMPEVPLAYISIKPSPARERYMPLISDCNALIKAYLATQKHTIFIDTYSLMLTPEGKLRPELYIEDQLHMNKKGYAIWIDAIKPHLIR